MTDFITGLRQVIQDLVAPDLKAIQAKQDAMSRQNEVQFDALVRTLEAFRAEMRSEFAALRATNQLEVLRQVSPLSERISLVEKGPLTLVGNPAQSPPNNALPSACISIHEMIPTPSRRPRPRTSSQPARTSKTRGAPC